MVRAELVVVKPERIAVRLGLQVLGFAEDKPEPEEPFVAGFEQRFCAAKVSLWVTRRKSAGPTSRQGSRSGRPAMARTEP